MPDNSENPYEYIGSEHRDDKPRGQIIDFSFENFRYGERKPTWFKFSYIIIGTFVLALYSGILTFVFLMAIIGAGNLTYYILEHFSTLPVPIIAFFSFCSGLFVFIIVAIFLAYISPILARGYDVANILLRIRIEVPPGAYRCQFTAFPRRFGGLRGFLDDSDDIGWIKVEPNGIRFEGDRSMLFIPAELISEVVYRVDYIRSAGFSRRTRIILHYPGELPFHSCEFGEIQSKTLPDLWRIPWELHQSIENLT